MVRLRVIRVGEYVNEKTMFQFQYGTIKGTMRKEIKCSHNIVSIPVWYD